MTSPRPSFSRAGLCGALLWLAISLPAGAIELARVEGFGPVSRGMASAGVAHPVGAAAMMLNPAELLSLDASKEFLVQVTYINANIDTVNSATGERVTNASLGNNRGPYYLPEVAFAMRRGDWAFGAGLFAAGGFGIEYGTESFLSSTTTGDVATGLPISSRIGQTRIPFTLAWQASPKWRDGASLDVTSASA